MYILSLVKNRKIHQDNNTTAISFDYHYNVKSSINFKFLFKIYLLLKNLIKIFFDLFLTVDLSIKNCF